MNSTSALAHIGLDIGSTTVKVVIMNGAKEVVHSRYQRHLSDVRATVAELLEEALAAPVLAQFGPAPVFTLAATGSGAIALAEELRIPFVQEVIASAESIRHRIPDVDVTIELGGEDAKITFFTGGVEQRMNETCAGGTGAFIDQMAAFLNTDAAGLNALAVNHHQLYPIASRCGVFAKTDILPLLNEGCAKEDIAASIFQAVVDQVVGGLACGREIKGKVAFLGGPLAFLPALRQRFVDSLALDQGEAIFPDHAEFFVAGGAALHSLTLAESREQGCTDPEEHLWTPQDARELVRSLRRSTAGDGAAHLPALFDTPADLEAFRARHDRDRAPRADLKDLEGSPDRPARVYLGIDSGSTTIKAALIDEGGRILYTSYGASHGEPLSAAVDILREVYGLMPPHVRIAAAGVTGYGSGLIRAGLRADIDEVETLAHCKAARFFVPDVSFVLDIGGQDIKCLRVRDGIVDRIQLNEACSAGCGSFVETFAKSLGMPLSVFVREALEARHPVDLGTRCTVFMNSRVKQAQKEGAPVGDIAAGLSYSVIKNALYKVIKISSPDELGHRVMAQGGAFHNDALLRALELSLGREVVRLDISGLMGAFGAALLAREHAPLEGSALLSREELAAFHVDSTVARCQHCTNHCLLTVTRFGDGTRFISGNRCERGAGKSARRNDLPNLYAYKYQRLFEHYIPLSPENAPRGAVGIPRVLNMYENYPLWFTLFTELGFRVELSAPSNKTLYGLGLSTIPSQTVCYPAKLAHGHIIDLIQRRARRIFYPCIPFEMQDFSSQDNHYNCPVVGGYPELLRNNIDVLRASGVELVCPFLPLDQERLLPRLRELPLFADIPEAEMRRALRLAFDEQRQFKADMRAAGESALRFLQDKGLQGIILAGHPYHVDPEVHHGIPDLITATGLAVLTEDSVAHFMPDPGRLRVVDQWTYHARLYRAAAYAASTEQIALVQLVSFGCGLDAVTADQVEEILAVGDRLYTQIKIDEGANLGAARIRVRSLLATMRERRLRLKGARPALPGLAPSDPAAPSAPLAPSGAAAPAPAAAPRADPPEPSPALDTEPRPDVRINTAAPEDVFKGTPSFTGAMRATHTILIPQMSPLHFQFLPSLLTACGYRAELLPTVSRAAVELGLRHVNNDVCYPAITVIGQLLHAVQSGRYDPGRIALIISQTGGGCRATNYIGFLRKALADCGLTQIPILSFNMAGLDHNPGFRVNWSLMRRAIMSCFYGDVIMRLLYRVRPYELKPGSALRLAGEWSERARLNVAEGSLFRCYRNIRRMIRDFDALPLRDIARKPRVGLVGEILLKFHPDANNSAVEVIEAEGGEAVMPDLLDFFLYGFYDDIFRYRSLSGKRRQAFISNLALHFVLSLRLPLRAMLRRSARFDPPLSFRTLRAQVNGLISLGHQTGEGWLLTAEMMELLNSGVSNILCMQPFGCLPNHITGKGVLKELKRRYPNANIAAVDYDPGASEVNQINRIKLMMAVAKQSRAAARASCAPAAKDVS
ncbi:MAG: 2-hydroxyacyl-CoA dehydratase [Desulfovibrionaceae bacterium]|nr:2-hydroxyacyl-CoA dehydratase [Desulfovibrionaceae bacterium]